MLIKSLLGLYRVPSRWAQNQLAYDKDGGEVDIQAPEACCWCLMGGLRLCYDVGQWGVARDRLATAVRKLYPERLRYYHYGILSITAFNDHKDTTVQDVRKVIREAKLPKPTRVIRRVA